MSRDKQLDVFVGGRSGVIKGIKIGRSNAKNKIKNLEEHLSSLTEQDQVTRIAWGDEDEQELLVACGKDRNTRIKIYDSQSAVRKNSFACNVGAGCITGISRYNRSIVAAVESGIVSLWSYDGKGQELINAGKNLCRMCHSRVQKNTIGTGGRNNSLKLYDLETQKKIFEEKSLQHDWLELKRPIWISDMDFLPSTQEIVTVCRYGNIHLYDPRTQRRPVVHMQAKDEAWNCLAIPPKKEKHVIVGSGKGHMNLVDLRKPITILNKYKGFVGAVTGVACSTTNPYVVSVSLDRYLRIHNIDTKEVLKSIYFLSKLSSLVIRSDIEIEISDDVE